MQKNIKIAAIVAGAIVVGIVLAIVIKGNSTPTPAPTPQTEQGASQLPSGHPSTDQSAQQPAAPAEPVNMDNVIGRIDAFLNEKFPGNWEVKGDNLSRGSYTENGKYEIADGIEQQLGSGSMISIFVGEKRISTTVVQSGGGRVLEGYPTPPEVADVLKSGKEVAGGKSSMGSTNYVKAFIPLKDKDGKTVAVLSVVVMQ